jgi:hypothetical protein
MYTSRTYYGDVIRDSDGVVVAPTSDLNNPDYLAYMAWLSPLNHPKVDNTMPPFVPPVVSRRQMLTALEMTVRPDDARTLLARVEALVPTLPRLAQIAWHESNDFERGNLFIAQFAAIVALTEADVDALFILAGTL